MRGLRRHASCFSTWTVLCGRRDCEHILPAAARCLRASDGRATADAIPRAIPVLTATLLPTFRPPPREPIRSTDFAGCVGPSDSPWPEIVADRRLSECAACGRHSPRESGCGRAAPRRPLQHGMGLGHVAAGRELQVVLPQYLHGPFAGCGRSLRGVPARSRCSPGQKTVEAFPRRKKPDVCGT